MTPPKVLVRLYEPKDEPAVRKICMETALYGETIQGVINDEVLISIFWLYYYLRYEVRHAWVAEIDGEVVAYRTGCYDTARFHRTFTAKILPLLLVRTIRKGYWATDWFWKLAWYHLRQTMRSSEEWAKIEKSFPAHCHLNISRKARHQGIGSQLLDTLLMDLRLKGVPGIHVSTATTVGKQFFLHHGFQVIAQRPTVQLVPGTPAVIYTLGRKLYYAPASR